MLLDYALQQRDLDARQISGYQRQEYTHLAVAAAVKSGAADCGLGILAAARALDMDFVPLFHERYDLVIPVEYYESELLAPLLDIIRRAGPGLRGGGASAGRVRYSAYGRGAGGVVIIDSPHRKTVQYRTIIEDILSQVEIQ